MAEEKDKKGFLGKAMGAFSSKDEKEEIASLEKELADAKKAIKSLMKQNVESKQDKSEVKREAEKAEKKIAALEQKLKQYEKDEHEKKLEERKAKLEKLSKPNIIATHTVASYDETLSHVALKYYKHATPPYWKYLLEHNKEVLEGSEKNIRKGMELEIPELPDDLKD
jgi:chromosome segregation ATPase